MKVFFIEHTDNGLVLTDFEKDYPILVSSNGTFYFEEKEGEFQWDEYVHYLKGCASIEELMDAAGDADFRVIDDPKNRSRARYQFGRTIAKLRKEAGFTQSELAERAGIKKVNLISIELGRYSISFDVINSIARVLGKKLVLA